VVVVVVTGGAVVVVVEAVSTGGVTLGPAAWASITGAVVLGTEVEVEAGVVVVLVVELVETAASRSGPAAGRPEPVWPRRALSTAVCTWSGPPRGPRVPDVSTSNAMSASETARITHQFGRPRPSRVRTPSVG
jgi:hypothetical protein